MKWLKKVAATPLTTIARVVDNLNTQTNDRTNAPSIHAVREAVNNNWLSIYPVGSIYMSVNNVSPATLFGGEWERLENRFLVGAGSGYPAGSKGGSDSVDITHTHNMEHTHTMAHTHAMGHTHPFNIPDHQHIGATGYDQNEFYWAQAYGSEAVDTQNAYVVKPTYQQIGRARLALTSGVYGAVGGNTGVSSAEFTGDASNSTTSGASATNTGGSSKSSVPTVPPYLAVYMWKRVA